MTYAIAAAGTGGHVYPGIAVAEALVDEGADPTDICFFGGNRMESVEIPRAGFAFVELELRGFKRSFSLSNLTLPAVVRRASRRARDEMAERQIQAVLCMGGYVTVPVGWAASRSEVALYLHEQNAHAGLANRIARRWAAKCFLSFPRTKGLVGEVVGNPLRRSFVGFDRAQLRTTALLQYDLRADIPTVGVFGGSLGARAINDAVTHMAAGWGDDPLQIVHLVGEMHSQIVHSDDDAHSVTRRVVGFERDMDLFYAAADLVVTRAGGSLLEVAATGTPMVVVPGSFGGGHQAGNAQAMADAGAAIVVREGDLSSLGRVVANVIADGRRRADMAEAARAAAMPDAARVIARK